MSADKMSPAWQAGYDSYPHRVNYPEPATQAESDWLRGWRTREAEMKVEGTEVETESLLGRNSFAVGYTRDS